jgi:hypothetical protein
MGSGRQSHEWKIDERASARANQSFQEHCPSTMSVPRVGTARFRQHRDPRRGRRTVPQGTPCVLLPPCNHFGNCPFTLLVDSARTSEPALVKLILNVLGLMTPRSHQRLCRPPLHRQHPSDRTPRTMFNGYQSSKNAPQ